MIFLGRTSRFPFLSGFFGIIIYLTGQFSKPFLSDLKNTEGNLSNYSIRPSSSNNGNDILFLWLQGIEKPFTNQYPNEFKTTVVRIEDLLNSKVRIWHNSQNDIFQLTNSKGTILMKYTWFSWLFLLILGPSLFFHLSAYYETKKSTINIKSYWDMWEYIVGTKEPIMKHNYRIHVSRNVEINEWFENLFLSEDKRRVILEDRVTAWRQFFNIVGKHGITKEVRTWLGDMAKGNDFLNRYDLFNKVVKGDGSLGKIDQTTDTIFEFLSTYLDEGRDNYESLGKPFKENFPKEYYKIMDQLNRLR